MSYKGQSYKSLIGMPGFSDELLDIHLKLYEGYVAHFSSMIDSLNKSTRDPGMVEEIEREFSWEFNGVRLHEAYFGNVTKHFNVLNPASDLALQIVKDFGSVEAWGDDFKRVCLTPGAGWAVLAWNPEEKRMVDLWIEGHEVGPLFYCVSILVNDCFDHAYRTDYGDDRSDYTDAFLNVIDWKEIQKRFQTVIQLSRAFEYSL